MRKEFLNFGRCCHWINLCETDGKILRIIDHILVLGITIREAELQVQQFSIGCLIKSFKHNSLKVEFWDFLFRKGEEISRNVSQHFKRTTTDQFCCVFIGCTIMMSIGNVRFYKSMRVSHLFCVLYFLWHLEIKKQVCLKIGRKIIALFLSSYIPPTAEQKFLLVL